MDDDGATLILTRPADRSEAFLSLCERRLGRRLPSVISPVIEILPSGDIPDLSPYRTVILTSASAVVRLAEAGVLAGQRVATVGERTAALARESGAEATCLGENVDTFLSGAGDLAVPCIHCHGQHVRGRLAERLTERGTPCDAVVVYDQVSRPLTPAARALLSGPNPVVLPLFSPRTARLVAQGGSITAPRIVIAMSKAVAEEWPAGGDVRIAQEPTIDAMCDMVIDAF